MKKKFSLLIIFVICLFMFGCNKPSDGNNDPNNNENEVYYAITIEYNNDEGNNEIFLPSGSELVIDEEISYRGYDFVGWYLDEELTEELPENYIVNHDVTVYAKWEEKKLVINFYLDGEVYNTQKIEKRAKAEKPIDPIKSRYTFLGWTTKEGSTTLYDFDRVISVDTNFYPVWEPNKFLINYVLGYDLFSTKYELYLDFFGNYYDFLVNNTDVDFSKFEIETKEDFLSFCYDWNANGRNSFYGVGDAFGKYYVTVEVGGTLENQPETTFIGYCYKNNMYKEFIPFLMQFFAYWRTDEGYTGGSSDPDNTGNDFFASPWASLVDTCKFFYFTSENLNDTYPWFKSERVKYALDNVPGVDNNLLTPEGDTDHPVELKNPTREGYTFLGWYTSLEENGEKVTVAYDEITVYAKWEKNE